MTSRVIQAQLMMFVNNRRRLQQKTTAAATNKFMAMTSIRSFTQVMLPVTQNPTTWICWMTMHRSKSNVDITLLPRDATQSRVFPWQVVCPSVHPSVRLCRWGIVVTYVGILETSKLISWLISAGLKWFYSVLSAKVCAHCKPQNHRSASWQTP